MNESEKAAAFDALAISLTNHWASGKWSWFCLTPSGGPMRETREEAIADLVEWAKKNEGKRKAQ